MQIQNKLDTNRWAEHLMNALQTATPTLPITESFPNTTEDEAYQIQLKMIKEAILSGKKITGKKIGLTSLSMQQLLGVNEPDYGHLLDYMSIENNGTLSSKHLIEPKVEAEIAFVLKKDLQGPHVTAFDVLLATDYVVPALEIVDSRIKDWQIQLADTIADNASSAFYVLGNQKKNISGLNLKSIGMMFHKNGILQNTGVGAAALGNPAACVAWLANKLSNYGISLLAGEIILSGALSAAVNAKAGDTFSATFAELGEVSISFE